MHCAEARFNYAGYLSVDTVQEALKGAGVPENLLPKAPTDHVCLKRAMKNIANSRKCRVESIGAGWSMSLVDTGKLDLDNPENTGKDAYEVSVTAKVIKAGDFTSVKITPYGHPAADFIRQEFNRQQGLFKCCEDLSVWLTRTAVPWVAGVPAHSRGGSYYVLRGENLNRMKKLQKAFDSISSFDEKSIRGIDGQYIYVPFVREGVMMTLKPEFAELDAIKIILNSLIEKTDETCDELHEKLMKGNMNRRGLKTQIARAEELEGTLEMFANTLGMDLNDLNSRLTELKTGLGAALLSVTDLS